MIVTEGSVLRVRLDGRLTAEEVGELEQLIGGNPHAARLELENLGSADASGVAALRRLRHEGVELCGMPPHLAWRLEDDEP